jgi:hypothetical protein
LQGPSLQIITQTQNKCRHASITRAGFSPKRRYLSGRRENTP